MFPGDERPPFKYVVKWTSVPVNRNDKLKDFVHNFTHSLKNPFNKTQYFIFNKSVSFT